MILVISDDTNQNVGQNIYKELCNKKINADYISLSNLEIKPCYSCGGCTYKSYGKCIVRDDSDIILPKLLKAKVCLIVTPLMWGTYSHKTKRMLDKICVIGNRQYSVVRGELVKGIQGNIQRFYGVGIKDRCSTEEKSSFLKLLDENINIMNISGGSFVVDNAVSHSDISKIVGEISG